MATLGAHCPLAYFLFRCFLQNNPDKRRYRRGERLRTGRFLSDTLSRDKPEQSSTSLELPSGLLSRKNTELKDVPFSWHRGNIATGKGAVISGLGHAALHPRPDEGTAWTQAC